MHITTHKPLLEPPVSVISLLIVWVDYPVTLERLEHWAGFEPATFGICNPMHWTALPPVRCFYSHVLYTI